MKLTEKPKRIKNKAPERGSHAEHGMEIPAPVFFIFVIDTAIDSRDIMRYNYYGRLCKYIELCGISNHFKG